MAQKQIPLRQVVKILNSQGHNIEYRNRTDGSIIVTSIDGRKTKIVEGNRTIRIMAGVPLSEKRKTQTSRNVAQKIIKPIKISTRTRDMLAQAKKELEKSNVKMKLTTDRLREHIKLYGEQWAYDHTKKLKRYFQGYAYEENVDNLKNIFEDDFRKSKLRDKIIERIEKNKKKFKERDLQEILEIEYNRNKTMTRRQILETVWNYLDEKKYKE